MLIPVEVDTLLKVDGTVRNTSTKPLGSWFILLAESAQSFLAGAESSSWKVRFTEFVELYFDFALGLTLFSCMCVSAGGIAAYNQGDGNVHSYSQVDGCTTGGDYSNDVTARAQWYKDHGYWSWRVSCESSMKHHIVCTVSKPGLNKHDAKTNYNACVSMWSFVEQ